MYPGKNIQQLVTLHTHASLPMEIHITTYYVVIPRTRKQNLIKSLALTVNVQEVGGTRRQMFENSSGNTIKKIHTIRKSSRKTIPCLQQKIKRKKLAVKGESTDFQRL